MQDKAIQFQALRAVMSLVVGAGVDTETVVFAAPRVLEWVWRFVVPTATPLLMREAFALTRLLAGPPSIAPVMDRHKVIVKTLDIMALPQFLEVQEPGVDLLLAVVRLPALLEPAGRREQLRSALLAALGGTMDRPEPLRTKVENLLAFLAPVVHTAGGDVCGPTQ